MHDDFRIGVVSDNHTEMGRLEKALRFMQFAHSRDGESRERKPDVILHAGDAQNNMGPVPFDLSKPYTQPYDLIGQFCEKKYGVPGNHDVRLEDGTFGVWETAGKGEFLHKRVDIFGGLVFAGYGGGIVGEHFARDKPWSIFNYDRRYTITPDDLHTFLGECGDYMRGRGESKERVDVLALHLYDDRFEPAIRRYKPRIVLVGHNHQHGIRTIDNTLLVMCGPILPFDNAKHHQVMGHSSYAVVDIHDGMATARLYVFGKEYHPHHDSPRKVGQIPGIDAPVLDMKVTINQHLR